jgi:hypothetical protein
MTCGWGLGRLIEGRLIEGRLIRTALRRTHIVDFAPVRKKKLQRKLKLKPESRFSRT